MTSTMTPEDLINELCHNVVRTRDEAELEVALAKLQSAMQEHREYLESERSPLKFCLAPSPAVSLRVNDCNRDDANYRIFSGYRNPERNRADRGNDELIGDLCCLGHVFTSHK